MPPSSESGDSPLFPDSRPQNVEFLADQDVSRPQLFCQTEFNDLVRDLSLSKQQSELLASRLLEKKVIEKDVRILTFETRALFFSAERLVLLKPYAVFVQ
ncbi:UNVERIFIED_CONTAM: hypothetical protein RMT77_011621 [Armadillidium vulgare]